VNRESVSAPKWSALRALMQINAPGSGWAIKDQMEKVHRLPSKWLPISIAPSDRDLEICVIDKLGVHALVFPCRRSGTEWVDASTKRRVEVQPTHWRIWSEDGWRDD